MCEYKVNWGEMWAAVNSEWTHSNLHLITEKRCAPIIAYRKVCEKKKIFIGNAWPKACQKQNETQLEDKLHLITEYINTHLALWLLCSTIKKEKKIVNILDTSL